MPCKKSYCSHKGRADRKTFFFSKKKPLCHMFNVLGCIRKLLFFLQKPPGFFIIICSVSPCSCLKPKSMRNQTSKKETTMPAASPPAPQFGKCAVPSPGIWESCSPSNSPPRPGSLVEAQGWMETQGMSCESGTSCLKCCGLHIPARH